MGEDEDAAGPAASACIERTRSAVLNALVVVGAGIAASGWILGRLDRGALLWNPVAGRRLALGGLILILVFSRLALRVGSGRAALKDPARRAGRFLRGHLLSAIVGGLAVPAGFLYGWAFQPRLQDVAPFWVVALATGFLALPREHELLGFDAPIAGDEPPPPPPPEPDPARPEALPS